ncbi:MAG: hypothetical protein ABH833_01725 [Parcubacteria group bacterium]
MRMTILSIGSEEENALLLRFHTEMRSLAERWGLTPDCDTGTTVTYKGTFREPECAPIDKVTEIKLDPGRGFVVDDDVDDVTFQVGEVKLDPVDEINKPAEPVWSSGGGHELGDANDF